MITGETRPLGLIGSPVSHSLSPRIQNSFAEDLALPYAYLAFDVDAPDLGSFCDAARVLNFAGFNVTMPHKLAIIQYLDSLDDSAKAVGAVNTVSLRGDGMRGYNTDGGGFMRSLESLTMTDNTLRFDPKDAKVLILGTGGAAMTVAAVLAQAGAGVRLASRRPSELPPSPVGTSYCHWNNLLSEVEGCSLLVNATPLGMHGMPEDFDDFAFLDRMPAGAVVYDLIYMPRETNLLKEAGSRGLHTMNGLALLIHQAALAFEIFTGVKPLTETVDRLIAEL